jgi:hypothetical protein
MVTAISRAISSTIAINQYMGRLCPMKILLTSMPNLFTPFMGLRVMVGLSQVIILRIISSIDGNSGLIVFFCVKYLLGLIAIIYLNSTNKPVMYTRNRMKPNHEITNCLTSIVISIAVNSNKPPSEINLLMNGAMMARLIMVIIRKDSCINVV